MSQDFKDVARSIEANPLGRLIYGQRELFHSNLIGWFFDQLPEVADATFRPLAAPGEHSSRLVERERGHMDLVFHWPDRAPLVIENKVFSLPHRDQLEEYVAVSSKWPYAPPLVLLSVSAPDFDLGEWCYLSYAEFAARILDVLPADSSYEVETMRGYAALVSDLQELVSTVEVQSDDEPVWLPWSLLGAISSSQMGGSRRLGLSGWRACSTTCCPLSTLPPRVTSAMPHRWPRYWSEPESMEGTCFLAGSCRAISFVARPCCGAVASTDEPPSLDSGARRLDALTRSSSRSLLGCLSPMTGARSSVTSHPPSSTSTSRRRTARSPSSEQPPLRCTRRSSSCGAEGVAEDRLSDAVRRAP
ncbi:MAG: hypothetical protein R2732_02405 [Microbacteriaceae bacterium]|jgi:hypothetical protein